VTGSCEHGNELSGSIKGVEFDYSVLLVSRGGLCSMELVGLYDEQESSRCNAPDLISAGELSLCLSTKPLSRIRGVHVTFDYPH
jgi:hypothetical protein